MIRPLMCFRKRLSLLNFHSMLRSSEYRGLTNRNWFSTALMGMPEVKVIDINIEEMMTSEPENWNGDLDTGKTTTEGGDSSLETSDPNAVTMSDTFTNTNAVSIGADINPYDEPEKSCSLAPLAPVDINGWEDEEAIRDGTVDYEAIEKMRKLYELPPIPKFRSGVYRFKGIKIVLPQRLLTPATYKYRLCEEDENMPDDTRICLFTPLEGVPVNGDPIDGFD